MNVKCYTMWQVHIQIITRCWCFVLYNLFDKCVNELKNTCMCSYKYLWHKNTFFYCTNGKLQIIDNNYCPTYIFYYLLTLHYFKHKLRNNFNLILLILFLRYYLSITKHVYHIIYYINYQVNYSDISYKYKYKFVYLLIQYNMWGIYLYRYFK